MTGDEVRIRRCHLLKRVMGRGVQYPGDTKAFAWSGTAVKTAT